MNQQNAHEYHPRRRSDGKTIQYNDEGDWINTTELMTRACTPECYRIKPEPRTFQLYIIDRGDGGPVITSHPTFDNRWKQITVEEVLK